MRDHYAGGYYAKIVISRCAWFNDRRDLRVGARPRRAELFIEGWGGWGREDIVIVILVRQEDWLNYILELYAIIGERNKWKRGISLQSSRVENFGSGKLIWEVEETVTLNILFVLSGYLNRLPRYEGLRMDRDLYFFLELCSLRPSKNLAATFFQESRSAVCL